MEELTAMVYKMGVAAEKALTVAIEGFIRGKDNSENTHEMSEILASLTVEVEEKAFALIVKYQPVATDLRIINSHMKIAYDFERFGRYAWDISYILKRLGGVTGCQNWIPQFIEDMGDKVLQMVRISIESLKTQDTELAKTTTKKEHEIDEMYFQYLDKLSKEKKITNQCTISTVLVVRYLERIADHATYIAEAVVYIATGQKIELR